jgi:AraC family transcriptional regulator, regulatory protein of adaptative response / methylated-DNA-[protein]-cysteine methyltransferase
MISPRRLGTLRLVGVGRGMADKLRYLSQEQRWGAVCERDRRADGYFYYVVRTTGLYSRPSCVARQARRENVLFFTTAAQAVTAGFRPCGRCHPGEPDARELNGLSVAKACEIIENSVKSPSLDELATIAGLSRFHFHRVFKAYTGVTPLAYDAEGRAQRVRHELSRTATVSDAIYSSGYNSNGHFYGASSDMLGMTPTAFRSGGRDTLIRYAIGESALGPVLVAAADKGVCAILTRGDHAELRAALTELFGNARLTDTDTSFAALVTRVVEQAELPALGREFLPIGVQETALRQRVRQTLRILRDEQGDD